MMIMTRRTFLCSLMCLTANHLETFKSHTRCRSTKLTTNEQAINSIKNLIKFPKYVINQGTKQKSSLIIFTKYMNHKLNFISRSASCILPLQLWMESALYNRRSCVLIDSGTHVFIHVFQQWYLHRT